MFAPVLLRIGSAAEDHNRKGQNRDCCPHELEGFIPYTARLVLNEVGSGKSFFK